MSTITATAVTTVTAETFVEAATTEQVKFHTVRGNGSLRRVRLLTTEQQEVAEWVEEQREAGRTMKDIAAEIVVSVPTLRRQINAYLLTQEVTESDQEEAAEWAALANESAANIAPVQEEEAK